LIGTITLLGSSSNRKLGSPAIEMRRLRLLVRHSRKAMIPSLDCGAARMPLAIGELDHVALPYPASERGGTAACALGAATSDVQARRRASRGPEMSRA
jgi:hypothetical protein